jgi:hypothetical protein
MRIVLVWLLSLTTNIVVSAQQNAGTHSFEGARLILKPVNADENWSVVFEKNRTY